MSKWRNGGNSCNGSWIRDICVFGAGSVAELAAMRFGKPWVGKKCAYLLVNKFEIDVDALAIACWAEFAAGEIRGRTWH